MLSRIFGRSDLPVSVSENDKLGMLKYANALSKFIKQCQTPMTIGIQGEWGSGKTSLMRMVRQQLLTESQIHIHWFETWQYGALGEDANLGLHLIANISDEIIGAKVYEGDGILVKRATTIRRIAETLMRTATSAGVSLASGGMVNGQDLLSEWDKSEQTGSRKESIGLNALRDNFEKLVTKMTGSGNASRFVVFIDDLDRLRPANAVSLLEMLKNFMDVEHCVFVLACDYEVVRSGVKDKFGIEDEKKAQAFFDKIIQVPFNMPVGSYQVEGILQDFLERKFSEGKLAGKASAMSKELAPMIQIATGSNPRALKRFLNILDLFSCVDILLNHADSEQIELQPWESRIDCISLFGVAGLITGWQSVANYLVPERKEQYIYKSVCYSVLSHMKICRKWSGVRCGCVKKRDFKGETGSG